MDFYQLAMLLAFLFPLAYRPDPGNMFFAATSARFGVRATLTPVEDRAAHDSYYP